MAPDQQKPAAVLRGVAVISVYLREGLIIVALVSGIPLAVSSLAGLVVAVLQAATQIQETSISYCAKFAAVAAVGVVLSDWFCTKVIDFFQTIVASIAALGNMP